MAYPYPVQIAWDTVNKFIKDWQINPYRWPRERDIQVELASRISFIYQITGHNTVKANYKEVLPGFKGKQKWNRVSCEHTIAYTYKDGKRYLCYPDIIVWDDIPNPDLPPDADGESNFPILWLCEIKAGEKEEENWDIEKLTYVVTQDDAKYGCWLNFFFELATTGDGIEWKNRLKNRLWSCEVKLPALNFQ